MLPPCRIIHWMLNYDMCLHFRQSNYFPYVHSCGNLGFQTDKRNVNLVGDHTSNFLTNGLVIPKMFKTNFFPGVLCETLTWNIVHLEFFNPHKNVNPTISKWSLMKFSLCSTKFIDYLKRFLYIPMWDTRLDVVMWRLPFFLFSIDAILLRYI